MKIVIGIMRDSSDQIQSYIDKGYHIEYLDDHVRGFGETLMKMKLDKDGLSKVRGKGYKISPRFWVNIALMNAKDQEKIVVADLQEEDFKKVFSRVV